MIVFVEGVVTRLCCDLLTLSVSVSCRGEGSAVSLIVCDVHLRQGFLSMRPTSAGCGSITRTGESLCS